MQGCGPKGSAIGPGVDSCVCGLRALVHLSPGFWGGVSLAGLGNPTLLERAADPEDPNKGFALFGQGDAPPTIVPASH